MLQSLDDSRAIQIYKQYVDAFGLGYDVEVNRSLTFQRTPLVLNPLRYAKASSRAARTNLRTAGRPLPPRIENRYNTETSYSYRLHTDFRNTDMHDPEEAT